MIKNNSLIGCVVFILTAQLLSAQQIVKSGDGYETTITHAYAVKAGGELRLRDIRGKMTISTTSASRVEIRERIVFNVYTREEAETILSAAKSGYVQDGSQIVVTGRNSRRSLWRHFEIKVPVQFNIDARGYESDIALSGVHGDIKLSSTAGDVSVAEAEGSIDVQVTGGDLTFRDVGGRLSGRTTGGDVEAEKLRGEIKLNTSGGDMHIRESAADLFVATSGGDIGLSGISGSVTASTSGGRITVSQSRASGKISTSGGDIVLNELRAKMEASTSGGDIRGEGIRDEVVLSTSGGDIRLLGLQAPAKATTSGGNIDVAVTLTDFSRPHALRLATSAGDINCTLPEKIPASVIAEVFLDRFSRSWLRNDIYSDFPLSKQLVREGGRRVLRATGDLNGGGDRIELTTSAGDIRLMKNLPE